MGLTPTPQTLTCTAFQASSFKDEQIRMLMALTAIILLMLLTPLMNIPWLIREKKIFTC